MFPPSNEKNRRKVNLLSDTSLAEQQIVNYSFSKTYIKGKKVLDIGCWTGLYANYAVNYAKEVVGIDPGTEAISFAKSFVPKAKFMVGTTEKLPFKDGSFDVVTLYDVIEHIPNGTEEQAISEINRVLKSNGKIIITTPNKNFLSILMDPAYFLYGHRHYKLDYLKRLLRRNGFKIDLALTQGGFIASLAPNISLLAKYLLRRKLNLPESIKKIFRKDYEKRGFLSNTIVGQKTHLS